MTNLTTLSRRVSEADGPSRELDLEVAKHVGAPYGAGKHVDYDARSVEYYEKAARYTSSLDAVAAIIAEKLPGFGWSVTCRRVDEAYACVTPPGAIVERVRGEAKTPALALLSAALLAIHERNRSDDKD